MDLKILGENIKYFRKSKDMSINTLAKKIGISKGAVSAWENGKALPNATSLSKLCEVLEVEPSDLYKEYFINKTVQIDETHRKIYTKKIPVLGNIACGEPIFAQNELEYYVDEIEGIKADFAVIAKGDSMINARIHDGDIVFIKQQEMVENGEIAAVLIGDEATLKRVYYDRERQVFTLMPENPKYQPMTFFDDQFEQIRILGKAVAFQSKIK